MGLLAGSHQAPVKRSKRSWGLSVAVALCMGCEVDPETLDDDIETTPRMGGTETVRIVTANLGHVSWPKILDNNNFDDALLFAWMQVLYLETLEGPGPTLFAVQESSQRYWKTAGALWPVVLHLSLGGNAASSEYADYDSWYQPIRTDGDASWGNAVVTNLDVEAYEAWNLNAAWNPAEDWDPSGVSDPYQSCNDDGPQRTAQVARTRHGEVDLWTVNVHLEFCNEGDFTVNACNLERLFARLDTLPSDDVVFVSGDFNIRSDATTDCALQPERFGQMVEGFRARQFVRTESAVVDHVFLRDPNFELSGARSSTFSPTYEPGESYTMSDHPFIETELEVGGQGMSPAFLPLLVALD